MSWAGPVSLYQVQICPPQPPPPGERRRRSRRQRAVRWRGSGRRGDRHILLPVQQQGSETARGHQHHIPGTVVIIIVRDPFHVKRYGSGSRRKTISKYYNKKAYFLMLLKNNQLKKLFSWFRRKICVYRYLYYRNNNFSINNHIIRKKFIKFQTGKRKKLDSNSWSAWKEYGPETLNNIGLEFFKEKWIVSLLNVAKPQQINFKFKWISVQQS